MTQFERLKAMKREVGSGLSQAYLSQIESGARPHLTHTTQRVVGAIFPRIPGFSGGRPGGYAARPAIRVAGRGRQGRFVAVRRRFEQFSADPDLSAALSPIAEVHDSRHALLLLAEILRTPGLADRLGEVLRPESPEAADVSATFPAQRRDPPNARARQFAAIWRIGSASRLQLAHRWCCSRCRMTWSDFYLLLLHRGLLAQRAVVFCGRGPHPSSLQDASAVSRGAPRSADMACGRMVWRARGVQVHAFPVASMRGLTTTRWRFWRGLAESGIC